MKALVCSVPRKMEYTRRETPVLQADRAIIRIRRIGICGTDLHAFDGTQPFLSYPRILGHELSGELVEVDNAPGFSKGEFVSFVPYFSCGNCLACRIGKRNCCENLQVCGVHIDGGMVEYLSVPSSSLLHSQGLNLDELALIEPLAIGAHGVKRANVQQGEFVLIVGAGPIGLAAISFAKLTGAKVIVLDINESRLQFCKDNLSVDYTLNGLVDNEAIIQEITLGDMATVVIDATGNLKAINNAFRFMAHGARYVLIGLQSENITFNHPAFHKREGTLMSSRNATTEDFEHVINAVKKRQVRPLDFVTDRVKFEDAASKFEDWAKPSSGIIKAMIDL